MNYHIMIDDKFIDDFIDEAETVSGPGKNIYIIRGEQDKRRYVKSPLPVWLIPGTPEYEKLTKKISSADRVFIHWLSYDACRLVLNLPNDVPVHVMHWGAEFYEEPFLIHKNWLFDGRTKRYVDSQESPLALNPLQLFRNFRASGKKLKTAKEEYKLKKDAVQRIDYILHHEANIDEIEFTRRLYDAKRMKHMPFSYNQNADAASELFSRQKKQGEKVIVQLGNSATPTNNHLDALWLLRKYKQNDVEIHVPLSYGFDHYRDTIAKKGEQYFGQNFVPITRFLNRQEYIESLTNVDIGIMYHNRSQAIGNCVTLLTLGKKLYLKKNNPIWGMFNRLGIVVFDAEEIQKASYEHFIQPLSDEQKDNNYSILKAAFSKQKRMEWLSKTLN